MDWSAIDPAWVQAAVGAVLLLFGRRLYFLLLGVAGFAVGFSLVSSSTFESLGVSLEPATRTIVGLIVGIVCALLAPLAQRLAVTVGGALVGGLAAWRVVEVYAPGMDLGHWIVTILGAAVGALLFRRLFTVALVVLSAWIGVSLILPLTGLEGSAEVLAGLVLFMIGAAVQAGSGSRASEKRERRHRRREQRRRKRGRRTAH